MRSDSLARFLLLPTIAMSLGWGLRGTIGGGQIGAMIPGAIVTLCLCYLLDLKSSLGLIAAIGAVGIGIGGQETYGQTIGFLRDADTRLWGLLGLTLKGAMWGLSGGVLVGMAFSRRKYRDSEIALGLGLMVLGTVLGVLFIDAPKLAYFSNRLDRPREEAWVGITLGALILWGYLASLRRETVTTAFAWGGWLAGGIGFGGGSLFLALGAILPDPYRSWGWWKMMEFSFGALYGLGLGSVCYLYRNKIRELSDEVVSPESPKDILANSPLLQMIVLGWLLALGGLWTNFNIPYRASFTLVAAAIILLVWRSNRWAWHVALSMTICGFLRDDLYFWVDKEWLNAESRGWVFTAIFSLPVVVGVAFADQTQRLTPRNALLVLIWLGTLFGLIKMGIPYWNKSSHVFVHVTFVAEAILSTMLLLPSSPPSAKVSG